MTLPDLSEYRPHKVVTDVDLEGVVVPGLSATFHRRAAGSRVRTVGVYRYAGVELFMAWGYVGEPHCRFTALRRSDGSWGPPRPGCPPVAKARDGGRVTALTINGHVLPTAPGRPPAVPRGRADPGVPPPAPVTP
ncbi:hypothetical protein [Micromonospora sp. NPDC049679]|uniref:hypothetical protein n=1 Tax=Micromonospora sp. NPDC049679 TaxID=3155920 RepID=UPI0034109202